jgi:DNA polymerase-3 subunit delta'
MPGFVLPGHHITHHESYPNKRNLKRTGFGTHSVFYNGYMTSIILQIIFFIENIFFCCIFVENFCMRFKDIPGNIKVINKLIASAEEQRIAHAQMFIGPPGSGKLMVALAFAQFLNCTNKKYYNDGEGLKADSCGECPSCRRFASMEHPDLHFLFPVVKIDKRNLSRDFMPEWRDYVKAKAGIVNLNSWYEYIQVENKQGLISVDDINDIIGRLQYKNHEAKIKVIIVWMVEKIQYNAAPKILKTLEEPSDNTLFILIAENHDLILPTILSRVQTTRIEAPTSQQSYSFLREQFSDRPENDIFDAIYNSEGNLEKAYDYLQNKEEMTDIAVFFRKWMRTCFALNGKTIFEMAGDFTTKGREKQKQILAESARKLINTFQLGADLKKIKFYNEEDEKFFSKFASYVHKDNLDFFCKSIDEAIFHIERNGNPRLIFTVLSFEIGRRFRF